jgi:hypothetical protein
LALSTSSYRSRAEKAATVLPVAEVPTAAAAEAAEAVEGAEAAEAAEVAEAAEAMEALRAGVGVARGRLYAALLQISISSLQMSISWEWVAWRRLR